MAIGIPSYALPIQIARGDSSFTTLMHLEVASFVHLVFDHQSNTTPRQDDAPERVRATCVARRPSLARRRPNASISPF